MTNHAIADENPQDTITTALARAVAAVPDRVFFDCVGDTWTYAEIDGLSTAMAHGLREAGVEAGEAVATILDNNVDAAVALLAIVKIGAVSAPVNTAFKGEYLRAQLADCGARVVLAEEDLANRVAEVADQLPELRQVYVRGSVAPTLKPATLFAAMDILRTACTDPLEDLAGPDTLAMLVYTSGTTGASKGCMIPHNMAANMGWRAVRERGVGADDVLWTALPLFHLNAIGVTVITGIVAQCRVAIFPRFSLSAFWPDVQRSGATVVSLLGSMASLIAQAPDNEASTACFGQLRRVDAAPFPPEVAAIWRERFGVNASGASAYGMSEAASIASLRKRDPVGPPGSSGRVGNDFDVIIADEQGEPVALGQPGEILCRPRRRNIMFQGYWRRPEATLAACRDLWFHTGDIGRLDANGYLYFVDRKKDYIRRRGENISTLEVEDILRAHPAIRDVAVHAVRSPHGEDDVKATIEIDDDADVTEQALLEWSIDRLPYFAVPLYIEFRDELPRGPTGKVLKSQLRDEGKTPNTWDREAAGVSLDRR